jgi:hypothetical protein
MCMRQESSANKKKNERPSTIMRVTLVPMRASRYQCSIRLGDVRGWTRLNGMSALARYAEKSMLLIGGYDHNSSQVHAHFREDA